MVILFVVASAAVSGAAVVYRVWVAVPQDWRSVAPSPPPRDLLAGTWEGLWSSGSKNWRGKLTAVIERLPDANYRASFDAETFLGARHKSVCIFHVADRAGAWTFRGEEDLGLLQGGKYKYEGTVDGNDLVCTYDSTLDKGVYRMRRR